MYTLGRYPNNILFHQPSFAYDLDLLAHLKNCGINYNEKNAELLNGDMKKVFTLKINEIDKYLYIKLRSS